MVSLLVRIRVVELTAEEVTNMLQTVLIQNAVAAFKKGSRLADPTLISVSGLSGAEAIKLDILNILAPPNETVDADNDTLWTAMLSASAQIQLDENNNYFFIQAPAYYRFVLGSVPVSPITIMQFIYK